jgi:CRISPR-associated protein Cas2
MLVLITYDISTQTADGRRRLQKVAKQCISYGQRVQNSVFEYILDPAQYTFLKNELEKIIDKGQDSLRFYLLGKKYKTKIEHIGAKPSIDIEGVLLV